ncbi:unnamed protein product [Calypogeia fissa]
MSGMGQSSIGASGGPKILLAKPTAPRLEGGASSASGVVKLIRDRDDDHSARVRLPHGSLNLLSESWDFNSDRLLPLMSDNMDSMVIGVLGPPGVGKSTIMNELYGSTGSSPGVLPPFPVQSEDMKAGARHCSVGIELRISAERLILLDCQPVFSASVLMDLMRSDGFSNISEHNGDTLPAELAHELIGLQLGVFLSSVCHVLLVVSEGLHDSSMWRLMQTVEMLKQGIPDPSNLPVATLGQVFSSPVENDDLDAVDNEFSEFFSDVVFVHTKLRKQECSWPEVQRLGKALSSYLPSPAFKRNVVVKYRSTPFLAADRYSKDEDFSEIERGAPRGENGVISLSGRTSGAPELKDGVGPTSKEGEENCKKTQMDQDMGVNVFALPLKAPEELTQHHHESYMTLLATLRNQILSIPRRSFARPLTERDWLRNAVRVWDLVKKSQILADYGNFLQSSGLYRR